MGNLGPQIPHCVEGPCNPSQENQCATVIAVKCEGGVERGVLDPETADQELLLAARSGDHVRVRIALLCGADVEVRRAGWSLGANGERTALMHAANGGHERCVFYLLQAEACANAQDEQGRSPLHFAAASGVYSIGNQLIEAGADPAVRDDHGRRPAAYLRCPPGVLVEIWTRDLRSWVDLLKCTHEEFPDSFKSEPLLVDDGSMEHGNPEAVVARHRVSSQDVSQVDGNTVTEDVSAMEQAAVSSLIDSFDDASSCWLEEHDGGDPSSVEKPLVDAIRPGPVVPLLHFPKAGFSQGNFRARPGERITDPNAKVLQNSYRPTVSLGDELCAREETIPMDPKSSSSHTVVLAGDIREVRNIPINAESDRAAGEYCVFTDASGIRGDASRGRQDVGSPSSNLQAALFEDVQRSAAITLTAHSEPSIAENNLVSTEREAEASSVVNSTDLPQCVANVVVSEDRIDAATQEGAVANASIESCVSDEPLHQDLVESRCDAPLVQQDAVTSRFFEALGNVAEEGNASREGTFTGFEAVSDTIIPAVDECIPIVSVCDNVVSQSICIDDQVHTRLSTGDDNSSLSESKALTVENFIAESDATHLLAVHGEPPEAMGQ